MKRVLITGANSYIGTSFESYLRQWPEQYQVDTIDMVDGSWREKDFTGYDSIFHVAGIAHIKENRANRALYYQVNRDLALQAAAKAKGQGVRQFVFLSSMSVYGMDTGIITKDTMPQPKSHYGRSKLQAEEGLKEIEDADFSIAILRPPMIYGKGCKGNYQTLTKLALRLPIFPYIKNRRSMLYIGNLAEFVRLIIENEERGIFWPQNCSYVNTGWMVKEIAAAHGRNVHLMKGCGWILKILCYVTKYAAKAFGSLIYDMQMSQYHAVYCKYDNMETICLAER